MLTHSWRGYSFIHTYHKETSLFICRANQWTGFFMIEASVMKELTNMFLYYFEKSENNDRFLKSTLAISDKYWHFENLFYCKTYTRSVFRTQSNIYNKVFLWFLQRGSTIDVRLGSKYASVYIYIQVSLIEIIWILNVFAVKYTFSDKRRMKWSSSEWIKRNFLNFYLILAYWCSRCMIHSEWRFKDQT